MKNFAIICLGCLGILLVPSAPAITMAQIDIFLDGSPNNSINGNPNRAKPSMNVGSSALGGLQDDFPKITNDSRGADDGLTTIDPAQSRRPSLPADFTKRGAVALALVVGFLLWCVRAFQSVLIIASNLFRPLTTLGPPFRRI